MTPGVAYNGVSSAEGGGNIFRDVRFWVSRRVPSRDAVIHKIKNNGGAVVAVEKDADICIADHARKDAPPGSYSWKFVTESVENGVAQLKDRYAIGRPADMPGSVGAGAHARSFRVPFTTADDAALCKWMLSLSKDAATRGNQIFQELECINSRHTWQSWRNRYIKVLLYKPEKERKRLAAMATAQENEQRASATKNPASPASNKATEAIMSQGQEGQSPTVEGASNAQPHTRVKGRLPTSMSGHREVPDERRGSETKSAPSRSVASRKNGVYKEITPPCCDSPEKDTAGAAVVESAVSKANAVYEDNANEEQDAITGEGSSMHTIRDQFYSDLRDYMIANDLEIETQFEFGGKEWELWDLHEAVKTQNVPQEELDWRRVAGALGYGWVLDERVVGVLQRCYEANLADFEDIVATFSPESEKETGEAADSDAEKEAVALAPYAEQLSRQGHVPSSPPAGLNARKRSLELQPESSGHLPKRRRLGRNAIIPSTPDQKLGVVRDCDLAQASSPSLRPSMMRNDPQELPPLRQLEVERTPEPVTEDDRFKTPSMRPQSRDSSFDIASSQQPQSESPVEPPTAPMDGFRNSSPDTPSASKPSHPSPRQARPSQEARPRLSQTAAPSRQQLEEQRQPASAGPSSDRVDDDNNRREISEWIQYYEGLEYPRHIVVEAFRRTSLVPGDIAGLVMRRLKNRQCIPTHHEGIWTDRDDASLRLVDSVDASKTMANAEEAQLLRAAKKEWNRLVHKHKLEGIELRRKFLEAEAALGEEYAGRRDLLGRLDSE